MSYIYVFYSRNAAMRFHDAVKKAGGSAGLVSAPTGGSGCGLAVSCADRALCQSTLALGHYADMRAAYEFDGREYKPLYGDSRDI